jgi:hypothetical protein
MMVTGDNEFLDGWLSCNHHHQSFDKLWLQDDNHSFVIGLAGMAIKTIISCEDNN